MESSQELCDACAELDIFSLFTGPRYFPGRGHHHQKSVLIGTLAEVEANEHCAFCRLLNHDIHSADHIWKDVASYKDTSHIQVCIRATRADYSGEMKYIDEETQDKVATKLKIFLNPLPGLSAEDEDIIMHPSWGNGIQLLSPDSIDPARPLMNGYKHASLENSLQLLREWMETCVETHKDESETGSCRRPYFRGPDARPDYGIRVIDVQNSSVVEKEPGEIDYAALSYVWDAAHRKSDVPEKEVEVSQRSSSVLPSRTPKVIEDAISVCIKLGIPYLWVDRYCIDQSDLLSKGTEIEGMAFRYLYAKITLIAGINAKADSEVGLFQDDEEITQRVETIQGRKYITAMPTIIDDIHSSQWRRRAWTMQEGQLANRCAFFGTSGISFLCGQGHWRDSLHNGPYGHDATMNGIKSDCEGYYVLSWMNWMRDKTWHFSDYNSLLMSYTPRDLSFESDKLHAVTGCLNFISEVKDISPFVFGLPSVDFHYAILWYGEYDRPRPGFPSWSWAAWHSLQNHYLIYPKENDKTILQDNGTGDLHTIQPASLESEMEGLLITLTERPHHKNRCLQKFADISYHMYKIDQSFSITSEVSHFSFEILSSVPKETSRLKSTHLDVPFDFDSTNPASIEPEWEAETEYHTPFTRLRLRDSFGNLLQYHYPRWYDHWPPLKLNFPSTLRGSTLSWLLKDGIDLIMIVEVEVLEADKMELFHLVLCLGVDRRGEIPQRLGMFCIPKEVWERAGPRIKTLMMN